MNSSDNYVKSEELNSKNQGVSDSGSYMIIKLAISGGERERELIKSCCKAQKCRYIQIYKNKFGILTDNETKIALGQVASNSNKEYDIKPFIDIYKCSKTKPLVPFLMHRNEPYASILLDNKYFMNLIGYCVENNFEINYVDFITPQGTHYRKENIEETKKEFQSENPDKAVELSLSYEDNEIIVKKSGYVILASGAGLSYYDENKDTINEIISVGFSNNYGTSN